MLKNLEVPGLNDLDDASLHYVEVSFGVQQPWVGACVSLCLAHKYINNLALLEPECGNDAWTCILCLCGFNVQRRRRKGT